MKKNPELSCIPIVKGQDIFVVTKEGYLSGGYFDVKDKDPRFKTGDLVICVGDCDGFYRKIGRVIAIKKRIWGEQSRMIDYLVMTDIEEMKGFWHENNFVHCPV